VEEVVKKRVEEEEAAVVAVDSKEIQEKANQY
jgi:hypothetical protein